MQGNTSNSRGRYEILDGLRGVAAVVVIWFHFFEGFATSPVDQVVNHGYLAVDFFFVLSGFVIGYAYDGRWGNGGLTPGRFMLRRVIRLEPMLVLAVALGAVSYAVQGCVKWDGTQVPVWMLLVSLVLGMLMIPAYPGVWTDVRGYGEMFPLNGPSWSLFFEYIGSVLYAFWLHRLSSRWLGVVVAVTGAGLATAAFTDLSGAYNVGFGWSLAGWGALGGFLRLAFSFSAGLLLSRVLKPRRVRGAFWIAAVVIVAVMVCPYVGGDEPSMLNALYDAGCTLVVFPAVVALGACGVTTDRTSGAICEFLGRISYPVYIIHYPVMYLFYNWVWSTGKSFGEVWPVCCCLFVVIIGMAWVAMRFYDEPVRRWLGKRLK